MNLRRALAWFRRRLVAMAEAGTLRVLSEGRMRDAVSEDDIDAWLVGEPLPSVIAYRETAPIELAQAGVEIG